MGQGTNISGYGAAGSTTSIANISGNSHMLLAEFWPIQLIHDMISLNFGLGCYGCSYCVTTMVEERAAIQGPSYETILSGKEMIALLNMIPAYNETNIRIRLSNAHDATLIPISDLEYMLNNVSTNHPVSVLVHRAMSNKFLAAIKGHENMVLTVTVTPPHDRLLYDYPMEEELGSFLRADCKKILNLAPLVQETLKDTEKLLKGEGSLIIPKGTVITLSPLTFLDKIPAGKFILANPVTPEELNYLADIARSQGYIVFNSNECAVSYLLDKKSFDFSDIAYPSVKKKAKDTGLDTHLANQCVHCPGAVSCADVYTKESPKARLDLLRKKANSIGFEDIEIVSYSPGLIVISAQGISKSETSYLTNALDIKVMDLSSNAKPTQEQLSRWVENGFLPVDILNSYGAKMLDAAREHVKKYLEGHGAKNTAATIYHSQKK